MDYSKIIETARKLFEPEIEEKIRQLHEEIDQIVSNTATRGFPIPPGPMLGEISDVCMKELKPLIDLIANSYKKVLNESPDALAIYDELKKDFIKQCESQSKVLTGMIDEVKRQYSSMPPQSSNMEMFELDQRVKGLSQKHIADFDLFVQNENRKRIGYHKSQELFEVNQPIEIQKSLSNFLSDYPEPSKAAFIIMKFGTTKIHNEIVCAIKDVLTNFGMVGVRADDKQYHDDLFNNILTYMHGCGFGIAVFEHIEADDFNPNVSLEVGYMLGIGKPVCLLKDITLKTLHTDLVGRLYKVFDSRDPKSTLKNEITKWMSDKQFVKL